MYKFAMFLVLSFEKYVVTQKGSSSCAPSLLPSVFYTLEINFSISWYATLFLSRRISLSFWCVANTQKSFWSYYLIDSALFDISFVFSIVASQTLYLAVHHSLPTSLRFLGV